MAGRRYVRNKMPSGLIDEVKGATTQDIGNKVFGEIAEPQTVKRTANTIAVAVGGRLVTFFGWPGKEPNWRILDGR